MSDDTSTWGEESKVAKSMFWFVLPDGQKFSHFDMTGAEAAAIEKRLDCSWWALRPGVFVEHAMAGLETFLARTDPQGAAKRVAEMTMAEIDAAVIYEEGRNDDLPDSFEDGAPKAETAAPLTSG